MAIPTSAAARAGASLMPSPILATRSPAACISPTMRCLSSGSSSARTAMPSCLPIASAVRRLSPVSITVFTPARASMSSPCLGVLARFVPHRDGAGHRAAGHQHRAGLSGLVQRGDLRGLIGRQRHAGAGGLRGTQEQLVAIDRRDHALAADRACVRGGRHGQVARRGLVHDRLGQRMAGPRLHRGGQAQHVRFRAWRNPARRSPRACPGSACRSCRTLPR